MTTNCDTAELSRVNDFNAAHPIGSWVRYWTGTREDAAKTGQTRTRAQLLGGHTAVVWVTGHGACIALTHVDPIPGQPDDIEDDSRDLPDPAQAAERVREYICANGDGIYDVLEGHPLYARDLEAVCRLALALATERDDLAAELDKVRAQLAEYAEDNHRVAAALTAANHRADGLAADVTSLTKAQTAYANENARLRQQLDEQDPVIEAAKRWAERYANPLKGHAGMAEVYLFDAVRALPNKAEVTR